MFGRIMKKKIPLKTLLNWRLEKAKAGALRAPTAARLLALTQPWWETSPEQFRLAVQRLQSIEIPQTHTKSQSSSSRARDAVPALIIGPTEELETSVRILRLDLNDGRLQLSFQCPGAAEQKFEVTFVSEFTSKPVLYALAARSLSGEYWLEAELAPEAEEELKVTDLVPFRLILRPVASPD
jgi:hypothetical protein